VWEDAVDDQYSCHADIIVEDGQMLDWEGHQILIKMAPGHSAGSNLIIIDDNAMFSGDCMLSESVPAARFPGGDPKAFQEIVLPYLKSMNQDIQVYPGHYDAFCLREYYILK
jgi:glyoxylase-like metal-dependent hydrolase (beta-lactamase superfamily II)